MLKDCGINPSDIWSAFCTPHFKKSSVWKLKLSDRSWKPVVHFGGFPQFSVRIDRNSEQKSHQMTSKLSEPSEGCCFFPLKFSYCWQVSRIRQQNNLINPNKQKNTLIQWLRFQKAHCEPEKQFCIKFVSNNRIKGILLVQKRLSILMYHELFLNSAYKTCLVGKTCHLLSSSKSITAVNKECLYFSRPKRFLCKFFESRWSAA